ncbi:MAG: FtsX-like permease family protein [Acidobacteria bacterium]|nr:FtsX-like permease family protein [Acidobacteriota bacterium]
MVLDHDFRFTLAALSRRPALTVSAVGLLAVAMFVVSVLVAVAGSLLLRPLAYPEARLLGEVGLRGSWGEGPGSYETLQTLRSAARTVDRAEGYAVRWLALGGGGDLELVSAANVTPGAFGLLGATSSLGRLLLPEDAAAGAPRVVVLAWRTWQHRFGADPAILGRTVRIDGAPCRVVGVLRRGFTFPGTLGKTVRPDLYLPYRQPTSAAGVRSRDLVILVHRAPPASWRAVRHELGALLHNREVSPVVMPLRHAILGSAEGPLRTLLGIAWLIAVLAACNLAILLLARTDARGGELAVRVVVGARPWTVVRLVVLEAALLAVVGTAVGLGAAAAVQRWLGRSLTGSLPQVIPVHVDRWVILIVVVVATAAALAAALPATLAVLRVSYAALLKGVGSLSGGGRWAGRMRRLLVALEVAMAAGVLTVTAAVTRSAGRLVQVPLGFRPQGVSTSLLLPVPHGPKFTLEQQLEVYHRLRGTLGRTALSTGVPLGETRSDVDVVSSDGRHLRVRVQYVTERYFDVLAIPILDGRSFSAGETRAGAPIAIVSRGLARSLWQQPRLGRRLALGEEFSPGNTMVTVVGIATDVLAEGPAKPPPPTLYLPFGMELGGAFAVVRSMTPPYVVARTSTEPERFLGLLRRAVNDVGCQVIVRRPQRLSARIRASLENTLLLRRVLLGLTIAALALACGGVYGLVTFWIVQRRRELGIRAACGATPGRLVRDLLAEVARVVVPAAAVGVSAGIGGAWYVASRIPGLEIPTAALAMAILVAAALSGLLGALPGALRVTFVDTAMALRHE